MTAHPPPGLPERRPEWLAAAAVPLWIIATALSAWLDVWVAIGGVALLVSALALAWLPHLLRTLLGTSGRIVTLGLAAAGTMGLATYVLFPVAVSIVPGVSAATSDLYLSFHANRPVWVIGLFLVPVVTAEELVWRGLVQEAIGRHAGQLATVLLTGLVYGLAHILLGSPLLVAVAIACGLYWSALRWQSHSLLPGLIAHLVWDVLILANPLTGR